MFIMPETEIKIAIYSFIIVFIVCFCMFFYSSHPVYAGEFMKKITIDHTKVSITDQRDFPVLIYLTDPELKSTAHGGQVSRSQGEDIYFTLQDRKTEPPYEITVYNPESGELKAWVKIPLLSSSIDTEIFLCYGDLDRDLNQNTYDVWDSHYTLVEHLNNTTAPDIEVSESENMNFDSEITVQAWVNSDSFQAEALQPLVSKWSPLSSFDTFTAYNAGKTDGITTIGYFGAVFDGQYIYFVPQRTSGNYDYVHGRVLRYNTHGDFKDPGSYESYDAGNTADLNTKGYYGAVFDGKYVYFVPRHVGYEFHTRILRFETQKDFKNSGSWDAYEVDVSEPHSSQNAAFDGRYIYFCPGYKGDPKTAESLNNLSGSVLRFDTEGGFKDPSSYKEFDATSLSEDAVCFDGGAFDGRYIYFVPLLKSVVLQYDTHGDFDDAASWKTFDAKPLNMGICVGAVFDGRYLFIAPYLNGVVVRYDTRGDFTNTDNWLSYDASNTAGLDTGGFDGGFFDGKYVYFLPFVSKNGNHGNFLRYDTSGQFDATDSWDAHDTSMTDDLETLGYDGGAFDGRYFYLAPWRNANDGVVHCRILRYDTVGENASFSLRYCDYGHNGGLCAAVPGPSFIVNTENGALSIAAHQLLEPGWNHITGIYNGSIIKLYVNGVLAGERTGNGSIRTNNVKVQIGRIQKGASRFYGVIDEVRISNTARDEDWIRTEYNNLSDPSGFIRVGEVVTSVENPPVEFTVDQNSPNPFNPITTINFRLAEADNVTVEIYNVTGEKVETLVNKFMSAGRHSIDWDGTEFSAGVYFFSVKSGDFSRTMKMTLLK